MAVLGLRVFYIWRYRVDSDEPQHLHVVWNWSQGRVAYRDFFDNHTPLFHLLMAPLLCLLGERADILNVMRLFVIPFYLVSIWAVHRLAKAAFNDRVAVWAPVVVAAFPNFLFPTIEFRTDNLWSALWLVMLACLLDGKPSRIRSFLSGLLAGAALTASMKTLLLLGVLLFSGTAAFFVQRKAARPSVHVWPFLRHVLFALGGLAIFPSILVTFYASIGALDQMRWLLFGHNVVPVLPGSEIRTPSHGLLAITLVALVICSWFIARSSDDGPKSMRRTILFLQTATLFAILELAWPVITRQNYLTGYPVAMMLACASWVWMLSKIIRTPRSFAVALGCLVMAECFWITRARPIDEDNTKSASHLIADVLRLTGPEDFVFTYKGEAVYRRRPWFHVLEPFTRTRLAAGLLENDIPEKLEATNTCVAMTLTHLLPLRTAQFLRDNYLPVGILRVAGQELPRPHRDGTIPFTIRIETDYSLIGAGKTDGVRLDDEPFTSSRHLTAGDHVIYAPKGTPPLAVVWTRAVERGFSIEPPDYIPERIGSEF